MQESYNEQSILDPGFRGHVIRDIGSNENKARKNEAFKAYECFKDMSYRYVIQLLLQQFDPLTVQEMQYAVTDISFTRKIIDKLARVYANGVKRTMPKKRDTVAVEEYAREIQFNQMMKKTNRYLKLFKNTAVYVCPKKSGDKYKIKVMPYPPFFYDVIEDPNDPEVPLVYILSNFKPTNDTLYKEDPGIHSISPIRNTVMPRRGDGVDQIIADAPTDKDDGEFIWWSKNYHFTTNRKGEIISEGDGLNPIGKLPFINFAADQDGGFWALGGQDVVFGGVNINSLLTNINHIAITQGYGQLTMTGKNLPKSIKVGPNHAILLEVEQGDPTPSVQYLTANPPISDLMKIVEMYVALLLSTNNLSTSGFSATLSGPANFASGVAMMIDKSESNEDVSDQAQIFKDNEPKIWDVISRWQDLYKSQGLLIDPLQQMSLPKDYKGMVISFPESQTLLSEKERLETLQLRKDMALNTEVEILMRDQPDLTEEQALEKIKQIQFEKAQKMASSIVAMQGAPGENEDPEDEIDDSAPDMSKEEIEKSADQYQAEEPEEE